MSINSTISKNFNKLENILIIGNGGRENSLAWAIQKNEQVKKVYLIPGNAGSERIHKCERIRIDIDNKSDLLWQLDVKKSSAVPPPIVKRRLKKILKALVSPAERNFDDKVKRLTNREIIPVWERKKKSDSIFYSINREHPFIKEFLEKLDQFYIDKFERILYLIDFGVPVEGIYADFSDDKNIN